MFRVKLLKLAEDEYVLILMLHHIVSDGWSTGVLMRELSALYNAYLHDRPSPLPPLPIQYVDYAVWQREYLQGEVLERQLSYWKEQLAEAPALLDLPTDRPRPNVQSGRGAAVTFSLPEELSAALRRLSRDNGVTLFMTLLAAFQILLHRYSGQEDLLIGSPIAGRNRREVEGLIGFFVNTLVLRGDVRGNPSFRELLGRVRETALGAYAHQDLPFEKLVEELQPARDMSRSPLFQVMFSLHNAPGSALELPGLTLSAIATGGGVAKFDLGLDLKEVNGRISGAIEYNVDLFERATMVRLRDHFETLLQSIVANFDSPIAALSLLSAAEKTQLLYEWNDEPVSLAPQCFIHGLFETQAAQQPEAIAVTAERQQFTYGELNRRANQLAHYLQGLGVGPEVVVGICVEPSPEMLVAFLGTLKAGGAYLPLDPAYPPERLSLMIKDTKARVLLTYEHLRPLVLGYDAKVICLDTDWETIASEPESNPATGLLSLTNQAFIIYTSGSTGQPKGVVLTHGGLVNYIQTVRDTCQLNSADRVLQFFSISFDAFAEEVYGALTAGATLVLRPAEMLSSPQVFLRHCRELEITVLDLPTAYWHELTAGSTAEDWSQQRLRLVIFGGEIALVQHVRTWRALVGEEIHLNNGYGPTETTIAATWYIPPAQFDDLTHVSAGLPIGQPMRNLQAYVLDKHLQPVPVGVSGEIHLGGAGLARGYLNNPALTAERFIPHPFSRQAGARLYKTGDVGRYLPNGDLIVTGRTDQQVKIRGFRVELGEVETALTRHPEIKECVVIAQAEASGSKRLIAYVVAEQEGATSSSELRGYLKGNLPDYMIPSAFVTLAELPLTANGKVDRRALQTLEVEIAGGERVLARTPVEEIVAAIWAEVLGRETVSVHDNFFELGGHSLLATRVISRVRDAFGQEVPLRSLFEQPTVAGLAQEIEAKRGEDGGEPTVALRRVSRARPLPLSYAQERLWFLDQLHPGSTAYTVAIGTGFSGALDVDVMRASFNELIRRHESLRTTFAALEGEPVQIIAEKQEFNLPLVDLTALPATTAKVEAARIAAAELRQPFVLSEGPLLRASLLRTAPTEHLMLLTMHHIISDQWSLEVLFGELFALYYAYLRGENSPLAELPIQYADYAVWQKNYLQGELLQTQLDYWDEQLAGAPELIDLRTDFPRPATRTTTGRSELFTVPIALSESLRRLSRSEGVTLFMALLAAFQVLLHKYSGQTDIVIGSPIAGRQRSELEGLIGFFVNTLALRVDLSGNPTFGNLLHKVREVCLGAYAHQDLPFERLVEELQPERSLSHNPLIQVMFELENVPRGAARQSNQIPPPQSETAIFDLVLSLRETGEEIQGTIEYSTDLFAAPTIQRMAQHFLTLLEQIVANPKAQLTELSLLSSAERDLLLSEWSGAQQRDVADGEAEAKSSAQLVHTLFEQHAARTPGATAISFAGRSVSYGKLNRLANQLAHYLISRGVSSESLVGIMLPRSPELIVALLATLKAGGAYLPLDPSYPTERLASMSEDAEASLFLTTSELRPLLPTTTVPVVCLDEVAALCSEYNTDDLRVDVAPDNLAYMIYTSGSSGAPKGVMISHAALADYLPIVIERLGLTAADRFLQFASASFDVAVEEIFPTLAAGAQLVLCEEVPYGDEFNKMLEREQVSVCELPTAYWQEWVREMHSQQQSVPAGLRLVIVGGEKNTAESVRRWRIVNDERTRLLHVYGVTEATVTTSLYELGCGSVSAESEVAMPLGGVLRNSEMYVLDERMNPVPIGVHGELYLGGNSLGRGYRNKPEATAEKYVPHPYGRQAGERLYRTGDIVRWRTPALLEFVGRADGLVKVRGFRIELGEIETAIKRHHSIRDAAVEVVEKAEGDNRIVAYLVYKEHGRRLEVRHWYQSLKEKLPAYMVPSLFITVDHLPLTPNGKIDRQALPKPDWSEVNAQKPYVGPVGATQLRMQQIWGKILGMHPISVIADFFELGGHSLLAVRLMSEIQKHFGRDLPLSVLFQGATIEGLSLIVDNKEMGSFVNPLVGINVEGSRRPFFCAHAVGGNLVSYLELARQLGPDQPFYGLQTPLQEFGQQFNSLEDMAACYVNEIRTLQPEGPYLIGGWSMGGIVAFEMAHHLHRLGEKVGLLAIMDVGPPVDKQELETDAELIKTSLEFTIQSFNVGLDLFASDWEHILQLKSEERLRYVIEKAQAARVWPRNVGFEQVCRLHDQINTNFRVLRDYNPKVYPGEITFFKAEHVHFENEVENSRNAWAALSLCELKMHLFPCTHFELIHTLPHVEQLANLLRHYFEQVEQHEQLFSYQPEEASLLAV